MTGNLLAVTPQELQDLQARPQGLVELLRERGAAVLSVGKAWHGIHYLLTGQPLGGEPPLAHVVFGVAPLDDEDYAGYGPALATPAEMVGQVAAALAQVSEAQLRERYDPDALAEADIYPHAWDDEAPDELIEHIEALQSFYARAAGAGQAVVTFIA